MLMVGAISGLAAEPDVSAILARVQLLPVEDDAGLDSPAEYSPPADASPEERAKAALISAWREARAARFTKWVRHEDEFLSFLVPDDPRVRLEIKTPKDPVLIAGGQDLSKSISFIRCYRLTFRDETYCLLFLDRQSKFDDNGCFCGTVVYEKYLQHHGALYRFSLMRDGKIKKIQTLGEGLRLAGFEWTHMPISQDVYAQIALSVRVASTSARPALTHGQD